MDKSTRKSEKRKEEILHTAAKLFLKTGFSAVSVRDIAETMNIKAASLYYHVASKQQILSLIILSVAEEFIKGMNAIVDSDTSPSEKIEEFVELHVRVTVMNYEALGCLNNDWMHLEG